MDKYPFLCLFQAFSRSSSKYTYFGDKCSHPVFKHTTDNELILVQAQDLFQFPRGYMISVIQHDTNVEII